MKKLQEIYVVPEGILWSVLQASVHNAVVQVVVLISDFNWCEPYKKEEQYESYGSGFFIDEEGHLVTNAHILDGATQIFVTIPILGKQSCRAFVVGVCPESDLALLKIEDDGLQLICAALGRVPFLQLGDSDAVQRADNILVLGYPLGQSHVKSTTGIVSGQEFIFNCSLLQITAPVNPGSSGGPLLNIKGQVVGIAVAMVPSAQSVGYAIPSNMLSAIIDDLKIKKLVRMPHLGVRFMAANDEKADFLNNPLPAGLYISTVVPGTIADRMGLMPGDMLYGFNEFRVDCYGQVIVPWSLDSVSVIDLIARIKYGDTLSLVIYRNGERHDLEYVMTEVQPLPVRVRFSDYENVDYEVFAGMVVMELAENHLPLLLEDAPELIRFRRPENCLQSILIVTHIIPGSYLYRLRLFQQGVIIEKVNGIPVATLADFRNALLKGKENGLAELMLEHNLLVVLSLQKVLEDEKYVRQVCQYPTSDFMKKLK